VDMSAPMTNGLGHSGLAAGDRGEPRRWPDFRLNIEEVSGAVGDFGTLVPIVLGVAFVTDVDLGYILLFFSIWYIATGLIYRMPMPVEPMKAVGAIVIAMALSAEQIAASGIILGLLFLALGYMHVMERLDRLVPRCVVRGVQMSLALLLLRTSGGFMLEDLTLACICIGIALAFVAASTRWGSRDVSALVILVLGLSIGIWAKGLPEISLLQPPALVVPGLRDFLDAGWLLAIPQAPLTITNAILATSLLMKDLVRRDVHPDDLSKSIGLMNLVSAPLGGFPMCHGAGGLAAQYRFGARTGASNVISGLMLLPVALLFANGEFLDLIPVAVLGALLFFTAIELARHGIKTDSYLVTAAVAVLGFVLNIAVAFVAGLVLARALRGNRWGPEEGDGDAGRVAKSGGTCGPGVR
jgi:MFS superfamily sulfate permease-like transporter